MECRSYWYTCEFPANVSKSVPLHVVTLFSTPKLLEGCFLCVVWFHLASMDLWREDYSVFVEMLSRPAVPYCTVCTWACTRVSEVYAHIFTYDVVHSSTYMCNLFNLHFLFSQHKESKTNHLPQSSALLFLHSDHAPVFCLHKVKFSLSRILHCVKGHAAADWKIISVCVVIFFFFF